MIGEAPVLTGVAETATSNVEPARFGDDARDDEDGNQRVQNQ